MKQETRLLLIYPGVLHSPGWGDAREENTHMVYVYSFLREYFDVAVLDLEAEFGRPRDGSEREPFKRLSLERILSFDADYVGISCWSSLNYLSSRYFWEKIKEARPNTTILVGGYHPTFVEEDFRYPGSPFDVIVRGLAFFQVDDWALPVRLGGTQKRTATKPTEAASQDTSMIVKYVPWRSYKKPASGAAEL